MLERRSPRASAHLLAIGVVSVLFSFSVGYKLNAPSILLDYNRDLPSNFTLEVVDAEAEDCFDWFSEDILFIEVFPIYEGPDSNCSHKAIISSMYETSGRKIIKVTATHKTDSDSPALVCEVVTDEISSIEIQSISNKLSVGGPPLQLRIIAKTEHGNLFTSINGLRVRWYIRNAQKREITGLMKLSSSTELYESCNDAEVWEKRGILGHCVLAEGLNSGTAIIVAEAGISDDTTLFTERIIEVLPSARVLPTSPIYMLKHCYVHIGFSDFDNGKPIRLSQHQFKKDGENSPIISYNFPEVVATEFGSTELLFHSINSRYPFLTMDIHVVKPARLVLRISGGHFMGLEELKVYTVLVEMYDSKNNPMHLCNNIRVVLTLPEKILRLAQSSDDGLYNLIQAVNPGKGKIRAELKGVMKEGSLFTFKDVLVSTTEEVAVLQKIYIFPPKTFLPYEKSIMPHIVSLKVTGGSGQYSYAVNDSTAASIVPVFEEPFFVKLYIKNVTRLEVIITDSNHPNNIAIAMISVQPPIDLELYPTVQEAEVGSAVVLPVAFLGYDGSQDAIRGHSRKFDDCSKLEPTVEVLYPQILTEMKDQQLPSYGHGCRNLLFRCNYPGYSRVNVIYSNKENATQTFKSTTILACFKPLKAVHPVRVAVLALGTSKEVAFEGGPRKWPLFKEGHFTELIALDDEDLFDIQLIRDPVRYNQDLTVYQVTCKKLGESEMVFKIGNDKSSSLRYPASLSAHIKMFCSEPATLHLKYSQSTNSKLNDKSIVKVPFYGSKLFAVEVYLKDKVGRKFANISTLEMEWKVSDTTLAKPVSITGFETHVNAVEGYRKVTRDFQEFEMTGQTGPLQVRAKVTKYNYDACIKQGVLYAIKKIEQVSNFIDLKLVSLRDINADQYAGDTENADHSAADDADSEKKAFFPHELELGEGQDRLKENSA